MVPFHLKIGRLLAGTDPNKIEGAVYSSHVHKTKWKRLRLIRTRLLE